VREDRARLLNDIKLIFGLTAYLDSDTLWEGCYLASQRYLTAESSVLTLLDDITEAFRTNKVIPPKDSKIILDNPLDPTAPSATVYASKLEELIKNYPRRDEESSAKGAAIRTKVEELRAALLECFRAVLVFKTTQQLQLRLFTGYFKDRIIEWTDEVLAEDIDHVEAVEALGGIHYLTTLAENRQSPARVKYALGAGALGSLAPASISIGPPVFAVPPATTMNWLDTPGGAPTAWTIPEATAASVSLGVACDPVVGEPAAGSWTIGAGANDTFYCRVNNTEYTGTLAAAVYTSATMAVELDTKVSGPVVPRPFDFVVSGNEIFLVMLDTNRSQGMQLYFPQAGPLVGTGLFNGSCPGADYGWARGDYAPADLTSTDSPTVSVETTYPLGLTPLAATLSAAGTIALSVAQPTLTTDHLITVSYNSPVFNTPASATYKIGAIVGGVAITPEAGLSSPIDFIASGRIPTTELGTGEAITVQISHCDISLESATYIELAGEVEIGAAATFDYAGGTTLTLPSEPTVPLRIGDIVEYGGSAPTTTTLLSSTSPYVLAAEIPTAYAEFEIRSGLGELFANLTIGPTLNKALTTELDILHLLDKTLSSMTWSSFSAFKEAFAPYLTDMADLRSQLSSASFSIKRLPWVISLLRQHGYTRAAATLQRGDIPSFLPQPITEASGAESVLQQLSEVLNSL